MMKENKLRVDSIVATSAHLFEGFYVTGQDDKRMDGGIEQHISGVCRTVSENSIDRRNTERPCDNHIHTPLRLPQSSNYKFHNDTDQSLWWRDGLVNFANLESAPREQGRSDGCLLENCETPPEAPSESWRKSECGSVRRKLSKEQRESKKRRKQPETWKVNIKKNARLRGEEYVGVGGKIVAAKVMGPPCDCRMRCSEKIDAESREELHYVFWKTCNWEQRRQYIALLVKESATQRTRCKNDEKTEHRRQVTFTYSLFIKGDLITVCKPMFLSTFSVSEKLVRLAMDKKRRSPGGIIGADQRGRHTPKTKKAEAVKDLVREHIKSFPSEGVANPMDLSGKKYLDASLNIAAMHKLYVNKCRERGVPEPDIVKESYYRDMFKNEFNLGFKTLEEKPKIAHVSGIATETL